MSDRKTRLVGLYAAISAAMALVITPLLALAYFATKDGAYSLKTSTTSAWATPAADLAGGLLTFGSAERVYGTYLQAFAVAFPSILMCAWVARAQRPQVKPRGERWGWRMAITGYAALTVGLVVAFGMETVAWFVATDSHNGPLNVLFLALLFPGILLSTVGSTTLGISLLRTHFSPRLTAWLLTFSFPAGSSGASCWATTAWD